MKLTFIGTRDQRKSGADRSGRPIYVGIASATAATPQAFGVALRFRGLQTFSDLFQEGLDFLGIL